MEGWLKAVNAKTGDVLWKFKTPSGIIGNPMTYVGPDGKQYVAVLSGIGGWSGIGVAADMSLEDPTAGLGAHRRVRGSGELQQPGRRADGLRAAVNVVRPGAPFQALARPPCLASIAAPVARWRRVPRRQTKTAKQLRVCADPENMPFSNQKLEGFENKIADADREGAGRRPSATSGGDNVEGSSGTR